jgi:hypothetical protein
MNLRQAMETHLYNLDNTFPTEYENVSFTPTSGVPYQSVNVLFSQPNDYTLAMGDKYIEQGIFQITLKYPSNRGATTVEDKAYAVRSHFKKGTILTNNDNDTIVIKITQTPTITQLGVDGDRYLVAVSVPFYFKMNN